MPVRTDIALDLEAPGTILYTEELAAKGVRLNRFGLSLRRPENRQRFLAGEAAYMVEFGLTDDERALVSERDWTALLHVGMHLQATLKLAATVGQNLWTIGAHNASVEVHEMLEACPRTVSGLPPGAG